MISEWTKHLKDPESKDRFVNVIKNSKPVLDRLKEIMQEDLKQSEDADTSTKSYESGNWAYAQAHSNGSKANLKKYLKLIDLDHQKGTQ